MSSKAMSDEELNELIKAILEWADEDLVDGPDAVDESQLVELRAIAREHGID